MDAHAALAEAAAMEAPDLSLFQKEAAGDDRLVVRFFKKAAHDLEQSVLQGRFVAREVEMVQIMVPGDRDNIIVRPAGEGDKRRFAKHYEAWKKGDSEQVVGTPLEMWGKLNLAQIEEFRYLGVRTMEQLANLNDQACQRIPGAFELKRQAVNFLELTKAEAPVKKMEAMLAQRDHEMEDLKKALEDQARIIAEMRAQKAA